MTESHLVPRGDPSSPLPAHSVAEAHLYLLAAPCSECTQGPLDAVHTEQSDSAAPVRMRVRCRVCAFERDLYYLIPSTTVAHSAAAPAIVNPSDEPSKIIDVGQWIMLFRMIIEAASREPDKVQARRLGLEAAQCLDEAIKFYNEPANDLPPPEALFNEASRRRFESHPEQFSRRRLVEMRAKLPSVSKMVAGITSQPRPAPPKRRWWRRRG